MKFLFNIQWYNICYVLLILYILIYFSVNSIFSSSSPLLFWILLFTLNWIFIAFWPPIMGFGLIFLIASTAFPFFDTLKGLQFFELYLLILYNLTLLKELSSRLFLPNLRAFGLHIQSICSSPAPLICFYILCTFLTIHPEQPFEVPEILY